MRLTRRNFVTSAVLSASLPESFGWQAQAATAGAERSGTPLSPALVQTFAPIIHFHPDEPFLPCTIEHILKNGALKDVSPSMIEGQSTSRPAICAFDGKLWMVYTDSRSSQLYVTSSPDGLVWPDVKQIAGQHTSVPAIAAAWDKLWMAYTDANNSNIWVTSSKNGWDWESTHQIGQNTSIPALAFFRNKLWMAYSDSDSSEVWVTSSSDGNNWAGTHTIGQNTSVPALVVFQSKLWMIYKDDRADDFWITSSSDGDNWGDTQQIGLSTQTTPNDAAVPALAAFNSRIWMAYTKQKQSDIFITSSSDGKSWTQPHTIGADFQTTVPAMTVFKNKLCMTYTEPHSSQLWAGRSDNGDSWTRPAIPNPTQNHMEQHYNDGYYVYINESQYAGEGLNAPQYYAVQQWPDYTEITYIILCAYNGHQTVNVLSFNVGYCILDNFARHPGDIERVTVRYDNKTLAVIQVTFESHGDATVVAAKDLAFQGKRPLVYSSLNAHGTFNYKRSVLGTNPNLVGDWIVDTKGTLGGVLEFGDAVGPCGEVNGKDKIWAPREYRRVGLDAKGNPVNDQVWAKFQGRIGQHVSNTLRGARNFDGSGLSNTSWDVVKSFYTGAKAFDLIPSDKRYGNGPDGLGERSYIRPPTS